MKLIASWTKDQDASMDEPSLIKWGDGAAATLDDYRKHQLDTHKHLVIRADMVQVCPELKTEIWEIECQLRRVGCWG